MIKAGLTLAEWIARLSKGYLKHTGKQPDGLAKIKIKMEAAEKVRQQDKILKPDFGGKPSLNQFTKKEDVFESLIGPKMDEAAVDFVRRTEGKKAAQAFKAAQASENAARISIGKLKEDLPYMSRNEIDRLTKDVIDRKAFGSFNDTQRKELLDTIEYQTTNKPEFASGGLAYMLGEQPRVGMMYGGDPGFAFEYGGSWADWNDNHKHMMPVTEYIGTKLPKDRLPFRQELSGGGTGLPPIQFGPIGITPRASGSYSSNQPYGPDYREKTLSNTVGFDAEIDLPGGFKLTGDYGKYRTKDRLYDSDGNFLDKRVRDDHDHYNVGLEWSKQFADGGRVGFKDGGFNKGRRNFMKMAAGLASLPFVGKLFKAAKPAAKAVEAVKASDAVGMPAWFPKLVDKVIKDGKDVTKQFGTIEREVVHIGELPNSKTKVMVTQDLNTGNTAVDIGMGKHGWEAGRHGQPVRLELNKGEWLEPDISKSGKVKGKGTKTKDEFFVEEAEFTGGHPENIKYEDSVIESYGNHASDFSELELYATGKNVDKFNVKGTKKAKADDFAQGRAEIEAEQIDEFASGGIAHMLGR